MERLTFKFGTLSLANFAANQIKKDGVGDVITNTNSFVIVETSNVDAVVNIVNDARGSEVFREAVMQFQRPAALPAKPKNIAVARLINYRVPMHMVKQYASLKKKKETMPGSRIMWSHTSGDNDLDVIPAKEVDSYLKDGWVIIEQVGDDWQMETLTEKKKLTPDQLKKIDTSMRSKMIKKDAKKEEAELEEEGYEGNENQELTEGGVKRAIEDFMYDTLPQTAVKELQPVFKNQSIRGSQLRDKVSAILKKHKVPTFFMGTSATQVVIDNFDTFFGESVEENGEVLSEGSAMIPFKRILKGVNDMEGPFMIVVMRKGAPGALIQKKAAARAALPAHINHMLAAELGMYGEHNGKWAAIAIENAKGKIVNVLYPKDVLVKAGSKPSFKEEIKLELDEDNWGGGFETSREAQAKVQAILKADAKKRQALILSALQQVIDGKMSKPAFKKLTGSSFNDMMKLPFYSKKVKMKKEEVVEDGEIEEAQTAGRAQQWSGELRKIEKQLSKDSTPSLRSKYQKLFLKGVGERHSKKLYGKDGKVVKEEVVEDGEIEEAKEKYLTGPGKKDPKRIIGIYTMKGKWIKDMGSEKEATNFVNKSWGESVEEEIEEATSIGKVLKAAKKSVLADRDGRNTPKAKAAMAAYKTAAKNHLNKEDVEVVEQFKAGDKVKVPHKGKMVSGKIVRFDDGGTSKAQQHGGGYVVDVGEPASILVPKQKVQKEEVEVTENYKETLKGVRKVKIVKPVAFAKLDVGTTYTLMYDTSFMGEPMYKLGAEGKKQSGRISGKKIAKAIETGLAQAIKEEVEVDEEITPARQAIIDREKEKASKALNKGKTAAERDRGYARGSRINYLELIYKYGRKSDKEGSPYQVNKREMNKWRKAEQGMREEVEQVDEAKPLIGGQKKLDVNKNGKLDARDFKALRAKKDKAEVKEAMNNYLAFYNGKKVTVQAETSYKAQLKAIEMFKAPASKKHMVTVKLADNKAALANNEETEVNEAAPAIKAGMSLRAKQDKRVTGGSVVKGEVYKVADAGGGKFDLIHQSMGYRKALRGVTASVIQAMIQDKVL